MSKDFQDSALLPELKSWIDNCLVPILLKQYLKDLKKVVANESKSVAESPAKVRVPCEVNK